MTVASAHNGHFISVDNLGGKRGVDKTTMNRKYLFHSVQDHRNAMQKLHMKFSCERTRLRTEINILPDFPSEYIRMYAVHVNK